MGEKNNINVKIENHGVIPKEEEHATPEELYSRLRNLTVTRNVNQVSLI